MSRFQKFVLSVVLMLAVAIILVAPMTVEAGNCHHNNHSCHHNNHCHNNHCHHNNHCCHNHCNHHCCPPCEPCCDDSSCCDLSSCCD